MNRYQIFDQAFSAHQFLNLLFKRQDEVLRQRWEDTPAAERDRLFGLPKIVEHPDDFIDYGITKIPANERLANARDVAQHYQFRLAEDFMRYMPAIFRRVLMLADDDDMLDTLFLGTLGALSICMPNVHGSLFREDVTTNLYLFLSGAAASGKGKIGLCRRLLDPINDDLGGSKIIIPANSSDTALYEELAKNGGRGIIFESEADTLTQAFKKGSGKFSDGLRCAFHNEPITYLRRTGKEKIYIRRPVLSMVLTGTPGQVPLLLKSPENGLFSRILFYRLTAEKESFVDEHSTSDITGEMINDYMLSLGEEVCRFYHRLKAKSGGIAFRLTPEQHKLFLDHFHDDTIVYKQLVERAYGTDWAVEQIDSIMKRLGNICYRILMIESVSRLMELDLDEPLPDEVVCDDNDFGRIFMISELLFHHTLIHYDELLVATGVVDPVEEDEPTSSDMLSDVQRAYFNALPDSFITQKALQIGVEMSLNVRRANRYLAYFCELGILSRTKRGSYEKRTGLDKQDDA